MVYCNFPGYIIDGKVSNTLFRNKMLVLHIAISHEKREIKEFYDKKFLARKTGKKNKKLTKVKKALRKAFLRDLLRF